LDRNIQTTLNGNNTFEVGISEGEAENSLSTSSPEADDSSFSKDVSVGPASAIEFEIEHFGAKRECVGAKCTVL
jgi:hypothetical protein